MKVLVLNSGSSSLKFTLFTMTAGEEKVLASGQVERIGLENPNLIYKKSDDAKQEFSPAIHNYGDALREICAKLTDATIGVLKNLNEVQAIGHRVVHGGEKVSKPIRVDAAVKQIIKDCFSLAPLHNPPNLAGIEACEAIFPGVPNIALFDTAFHQTMPPEAYLYAVPYELYTKYAIRRYGFHGTSHQYVAMSTAEYLGKKLEALKMITCHLGNGCSMAAIEKGKVIDTTMGLTPLEGLVMGTRCGDIDPAVVIRLAELGLSAAEIDKTLNKKSGLLGVGGIGSSDMRDITAAANSGNKQAKMALDMFVRRVVKYVGAYYTLLNGADVIVFTGGVGEYAVQVRSLILEKLACLGIVYDKTKSDATRGAKGVVSTQTSKWAAVVMPTNEELMIARGVVSVLSGK